MPPHNINVHIVYMKKRLNIEFMVLRKIELGKIKNPSKTPKIFKKGSFKGF